MKTVLAFGTYDKLHPGHRWFLSEAKKLGDRLVVVVARDANVERIKGKLPRDNEQIRLANVQAIPEVDEAKLGYEDYKKRLQVITDAQPQVICLGYDQAPGFQSPNPKIQVVRLGAFHPEVYKSSKL
jgi:FAD synthetase